jgi:hypothetical protein
MDKVFVTYEQALALNRLGFNKPCLAYWNYHTQELNYNSHPSIFHSEDVIQLPLKQQVFRWFREKYGLQAYLTTFLEMCRNDGDTYHVVVGGSWYPQLDSIDYEEAENAAIDKLIEIAKQQAIS